MRPNRLLATLMLRRGARLWLVTRVAVVGLIALAGDDPFRLPLITTAGVLSLCVMLCYVETYRNHERDLLGNLGIKRRSLAILFVIPELIGELIVHTIASAA